MASPLKLQWFLPLLGSFLDTIVGLLCYKSRTKQHGPDGFGVWAPVLGAVEPQDGCAAVPVHQAAALPKEQRHSLGVGSKNKSRALRVASGPQPGDQKKPKTNENAGAPSG